MAKKTTNRAWNPSLPSGEPFTLDVDWEGGEGPGAVPFTLCQPIALVDERHRGFAWKSPVFGVKILATIDVTQHGRLLHVSVSHDRVLPPWPLMIAVKRRFFPADVAAVMVMPETDVYVNVHPRCLHIWQLPEKWGVM